MTWLEFTTKVKDFLPVDKDRLNVKGTYLDSLIRQAVIDLQSYIPEFRLGHESIYGVADLTDDGFASVGTMPDQAEPRDAYYVSTTADDQCNRKPLVQYDWGARFDLVCANFQVTCCGFAIAIDPQAKTFYVFPKVEEGRELSLFWDGRKLEFTDAESVPFSEGAAFAASDYVTAHIRRKVDNDLAAFQSHMGSYISKRSQLFSDERERRRFKNTAPSPQSSNACGNQSCVTA